MSITLFAMCKKSGYGYVRGTIIEKGAGATVAGITVNLTDTKYGSTHHNQTASAVSDAAGNYYIKYFKILSKKIKNICNFIATFFLYNPNLYLGENYDIKI